MKRQAITSDLISQVTIESWKAELEKTSSKYHIVAAWAAILFNPVFAFTDFINIPESWQELLIIRSSVSVAILTLIILRNKFHIPSYLIVAITFLLISLQNAYTYSLIGNEDLLGHNLNYIALLIGAAMFLLWEWTYSVIMIFVSLIATAVFLYLNGALDMDLFLVQGGVLLAAVAVFMVVLIKTRYDLTVKEIKARLALQISNEEIQAQSEELYAQAEEIRVINENLEQIVRDRTKELETKNMALEEYAFINAHKLRSPVASILGLVNLLKKTSLDEEAGGIMSHLEDSTSKLDEVVTSITKTIERGERGNKKY
jgi:signal transduction histidine kinase